ncbi:tetratricopeptide repeat protein [Algoriphagus limi]|uniref:Tetratricopeptide repeat protein n=1 Tax=Algoriphagus limi TaxID=2975273 RepID=A0ABT2G337_9BACT|nr:tetratricopeptide repeat protein [Algoriphagus limi]MCS5489679.1 tetratricopeptide repeat protein [Algoriphagus limi]
MLRKINISAFIFLFLVFTSCRSELYEAEQLFLDKQYERAISNLNTYLFFNVTDIKAFHLRARSYEEMGRIQDALEDYERIISLNPEYAQAHAGIGKILFNQKQYKEAELRLLRAAKYDPADFDILYLLGRALLQNKNYSLAEEFFQKAKELNDQHARLHFYLGMARAYRGDVLGCAASFNQYVKLEPDNLVGRYNRGFALMKVGYLEWALEDFEAVLKKYPDHLEALAKKGICLAQMGNTEGCQYIQEAASQGSDYALNHLDLCS